MKSKYILFIALSIFLIGIVSAGIYQDCTIMGNCKTVSSGGNNSYNISNFYTNNYINATYNFTNNISTINNITTTNNITNNISTINNFTYNITNNITTNADFTNVAYTNQSTNWTSNNVSAYWFNGFLDWSYLKNIPSYVKDWQTIISSIGNWTQDKINYYTKSEVDANISSANTSMGTYANGINTSLASWSNGKFLTSFTETDSKAYNGTLMYASNWNSTNESYYLKNNPYNFYNSTTLTSNENLWSDNFTKYNSSWNSIVNSSYYLNTNPYSFYNSTNFDINNYYLKTNTYNFYNSSSLGNPYTYWNSTFAVFNKTYADTLYSTSANTFSYYNSTTWTNPFAYYNTSNNFDWNNTRSYYNSTTWTNPFTYWNSTFATFNKTYADTLYATTSQLSNFYLNTTNQFNYFNSTSFGNYANVYLNTTNAFSYYNSSTLANPYSYWNSTFAVFNKTYADTLYTTNANTFSYWNSTFATFNKTYADTLYATTGEPLAYNGSLRLTNNNTWNGQLNVSRDIFTSQNINVTAEVKAYNGSLRLTNNNTYNGVTTINSQTTITKNLTIVGNLTIQSAGSALYFPYQATLPACDTTHNWSMMANQTGLWICGPTSWRKAFV